VSSPGEPNPAGVGRQLAAFGPYFAAESHEPDAGPPHAPWRAMGELVDGVDGVVAERVEAVRGYLGAAGGGSAESVELRVAASVMHLGLAARVLSPLFGLAVLGRELPASEPGGLRDLRWQPVLGSMFALSIPGLDDARPTRVTGGGHDAWPRSVALLAGELCEIMRPFGVSTRVLWGNVASALNGARIALGAAEPRLALRAQVELARILEWEPLVGTSHTTPDGRFQRRSCCLIYRAAPDRRGPLCGDCVLVR
jgi:hypothetical protein